MHFNMLALTTIQKTNYKNHPFHLSEKYIYKYHPILQTNYINLQPID